MTRVDRDKYSVLIRGDYLYALGRLASTRQERDNLIQQAVESFVLDYSFEERTKRIEEERSRIRILFPAGRQPHHHMYIEFIRIPDGLVNRLKMACQYPDTPRPCYGSLGQVLNAAIRQYLVKNCPEFPKVATDTANESVLTNQT